MMSIYGSKQVVREVPDELKELVQKVSRAFYSHKEDSIVLDYLLRNTIMNETQLHEVLKLDRKMLRIVLARLKTEHFLKDRLRIETGQDGKSVKQLYYYINYKAFVNVVKYKLHMMQKRIEAQERDDSCKAVYKCSNEACSKTYTEFDIDKLADLSSIDFETGEARLVCTFCGRDVGEMEAKTNNARDLLASFNTQMEPIYSILQEIEQYTLSQQILEPRIAGEEDEEGMGMGEKGGQNGSAGGVGNRVITVDLGADANADADKGPKEIPAWMTSASIGSSISNIDKSSATESKSTSQTSTAKSSQSGGDLFIQRQSRAGAAGNTAISQSSSVLDEDHIKKTLMHHENKTMSHVNLSAVSTNRQKANQNQALINNVDVGKTESKSRDNSDSSESDSDSNGDGGEGGKSSSKMDQRDKNCPDDNEEMMSSDDEDENDAEPDFVTVNGVQMPFDDVAQDHIAQMSGEERENYMKIGQKRFAPLVD